MKNNRQSCACFVVLALARLAAAATYSWDGNGAAPPSGNFNVADNWNLNTRPPGNGDTAQFNLGGKGYTVSFPGSGPLGMNPVDYVTDRLLVGNTTTVTFANVDALSTYTINNSTTAEAGRGIIIGQVSGDNATLNVALAGLTGVAATIGDAAGSQGTLNVNGSKFNLGSAGLSGDELIIGNHGTGTLNVTAGGAAKLTAGNGSAVLGKYAGSSGTATVSGSGSTWIWPSELAIGESGTGALGITGGGAVVSGLNTIGDSAGSTGTVTVDGAGSTWTTSGLYVGQRGTGTLTIKNGGQVNSDVGFIAVEGASTGVVSVDGTASTWSITSHNPLGVNPGGTLVVSNGGTVSVPSTGSLYISGTLMGNSNIVGEVFNDGVIAPGTSSGALNVPGALHITGNYTQSASGKLQIELGGNFDYDRLHVNGYLSLDGTLQVSLVNSFVPAAGNFFALLTGSWTGAFSTVQLPTLPSGLMWNASHLNDFGELRVSILGDYNQNGVVDAADYVVWRKTLGQSGVARAADGNGNGTVDNGDYGVWRAHFGQTAAGASGANANAAVPEPATLLYMVLVVAIVSTLRRRHAMLALGLAVTLAFVSGAQADVWDGNGAHPPSGDWSSAINWVDNTTPGLGDQATFNLNALAGAYEVTFSADPVAIQALSVIAGNVTFSSGGGPPRTLNVTSVTGGRDVTISGSSRLSLGTTISLIAGDDLNVQLGGILSASAGDQVNANDLFLNQVATATILGVGASLNASASATVGDISGTSTLTYGTSATGSLAPAGTVNVGVSNSVNVGVLNVATGAAVEVGSLNVGTGSAAAGSINVNSLSSTLTQVGADTINVGSASGGIGTINVGTTSSGGALTTGTGLTTISTTGTVTIGSGANTGTLNANGNITVDGGVLQRDSGSTLALAAGKTMTIQNGGRASFTGDYSATTNAIYNIGGTNSKLETLGGGALNVNNGAQMNVTASGLLSLSGNIEIGNGTSGTLSANGANANITQSGAGTLSVGHATTGTAAVDIGTAAAGGTLTTGSGLFTINKTGTVTVGSANTAGALHANGNFTIDGGVLQVTNPGSDFQLAAGKTITVQNGGQVIGINATSANSIYNVTGLNSAWLSPLTIQNGAQVNVSSGGRLSNFSFLESAPSGSGTLSIQGISRVTTNLNFVSEVNYATINIGTSASLATLHLSSLSAYHIDIDETSTLNIGSATTTGTLDVDNTNRVFFTVNGGVFQLLNSGSNFLPNCTFDFTVKNGGRATFDLAGSDYITTGEIYNITGTNSKWELVGGSGLVINSSPVNIDAGGTLTANALSVTPSGILNFNNGTVGITGAAGLTLSPTTLGTNLSLSPSRTLNVTNTTTIPVGGSLNLDGGTFYTGNLVVNGAFSFGSGVLAITGPAGLTIGASGPFGQILNLANNQALHVVNTLTVNSGAFLGVAGGFSAGGLVNNGDLVVINTAISAPVVNNHAVTVVGSVNFNGLVSGPGAFFGPGTAHFNGGMSPGASPANISFEGSLALADTNTLLIEIGGTTPGSQYDRLTIAGSAMVDGILNISLINGFAPIGGQQFTILTASSIINNGFALSGSAASSFNLLVNSTSVILQAIGLAGDYNQNGVVDAADYAIWRKNVGASTALPNDLIGGTIGSAQYNQWRANFGKTAPGAGSSPGVGMDAAVPEPSTLVLLIFAVAGWHLRRGRAA